MFTPFPKELPFSVPDGRSGLWTRGGMGGGGTGSRWKIISNQGAPKPVRHEKSCELYQVSRQYIAKANPTPASKLAFVTNERPFSWIQYQKPQKPVSSRRTSSNCPRSAALECLEDPDMSGLSVLLRHCSRAWLLERLAISQQQHHSAERDERSNKPELFMLFGSDSTKPSLDAPKYVKRQCQVVHLEMTTVWFFDL